MFIYIFFIQIIALIILFPFIVYALSKRNKFFTQVESGNIKFILAGESLVRIIHDVKGFKLTADNQFIPGNEKKSLLNERGIWWVGIPPFRSVHTFTIKKEKENISGIKPEEWITSGGTEEVSSLRFSFPRSFVLRDVELQDRTTINMLVACKFEVVNPIKLIFMFKGDFFDNTGSILGAKVDDMVKGYKDIKKFISVPKNEKDGFLAVLKKDGDIDGINEILKDQIGLKLVGISVSKYDPSDSHVLEATNAQAIALLKAEAVKAEAEGNAGKIRIEAEANKNALIELSKGKKAQIEALVSQMQATKASPDVIARAVADVLRTEAAAGKDSKLTTWVDGHGGAQIVLPNNGGK